MAIGTVKPYNQMLSVLLSDAGRQWDDAATGSLFFCLAGAGYTPNAAHTVTNDLGAALISAGDGAPIAVPTPSIDILTTPGETHLKSGNADFGQDVTITAKYLICVQPVVAGTFSASTSKLLWYVNLNIDSAGATVSANPDFVVLQPVNGWLKLVEAV